MASAGKSCCRGSQTLERLLVERRIDPRRIVAVIGNEVAPFAGVL